MITTEKLAHFLHNRDEVIREFATALNKFGIDNDFDTPDYVLANYIWFNLESLLIMKTQTFIHEKGEVVPSLPRIELEG